VICGSVAVTSSLCSQCSQRCFCLLCLVCNHICQVCYHPCPHLCFPLCLLPLILNIYSFSALLAYALIDRRSILQNSCSRKVPMRVMPAVHNELFALAASIRCARVRVAVCCHSDGRIKNTCRFTHRHRHKFVPHMSETFFDQ
jgi:hypothetical protein